jgi:hypothetical protein
MLKFIAWPMLVTILSLPGTAFSQVWLPDRQMNEGPGIKLGDKLLLHPGAAVEGGYDTNALRRPDGDGAGRLRLSAYTDLATRSKVRRTEDEGVQDATPPKLDFRLGLAGFYDFFFSDVPAVDEQDEFGCDAHLNLVLFPAGNYTLTVGTQFLRVPDEYDSTQKFHARNHIRPNVGLRMHPGGGTLTMLLNGSLDVLIYDEDVVANRNNKATYDLMLETMWQFLPKTALVSRIRFSPINYLSAYHINNNSRPVRASLGIRGLFTPRFGLSLFVGYGASFYQKGEDFDGVIASGELMFFITPLANVRLGAERDFVDSFYANFYVKNGGYLVYEQMFLGRLLVSLKGEIFHRQYSYLAGQYGTTTPNTAHRKDLWTGATLLMELRALDWLSILTSLVYRGNVSNFSYSTDADDPSGWVDYQRVEVMAGVKAHY